MVALSHGLGDQFLVVYKVRFFPCKGYRIASGLVYQDDCKTQDQLFLFE